MKFNDRVYGLMQFDDPVLLDLIASAPLQRLKGVDQAGYMEPWFPGEAITRFEHSLGVCFLLKKFNASLAEQVAGLIHDVSHTVFSHCADYALAAGSETEQSLQDKMMNDFVGQSAIPVILKKHGLDLEYILNDENFPLKEKNLPDLCADRIDYAFRHLASAKIFDVAALARFLNALKATAGQWYFENYEIAREFAEHFRFLNRTRWTNLPTAIVFRSVGDYLKRALEKKYITEADLFTTDCEVLAKIAPYHATDKNIERIFKIMNKQIAGRDNPADFDVAVKCKSRMIDPLCFHNGKISRVSEIDPAWLDILADESRPKEYHLKFE